MAIKHHLRDLAQQRVVGARAPISQMSADEISRLVYELEIHQEELEIQNEELRRADLQLKESRDRFFDLYDFAPVGYLTINPRGEITQANLTVCDMLDRERSQLTGTPLALYCDAGSRAALFAHLDEVRATGERQRIELQFSAGEKFDVQLESCRAKEPESGEYQCRCVITNISDRKQAERAAIAKDQQLQLEREERKQIEERLREQEKQLVHVARVSTLGEMLAGIAHEINQPLHAISNYATACKVTLENRGADQDKKLIEMVDQIATQAVRSGDIIKRLRAFATRTEIVRVPTRIQEIIDDSVHLTASEARRHQVEVRVIVPEDLENVMVDRVEIEQVLVNLIKNACEAMAFGAGPRLITIRAWAIDNEIEVVVEDSGGGLEPVIVGKIFDAFQTTKSDGMGLGLAISRSIIEAHGGRIWATPNSQSGTVLHFTLPAAAPCPGAKQSVS